MLAPRSDLQRAERRRDAGPGSTTWPWLLGLALVVLVAIVPSIGTFDAGLISDDGGALGYVHRHGPLADFAQPEYDLRSVRFWRPMVTVSLDVQEWISGVAVVPLRLFNLLGHIATALLLVALARRLGVPPVGALLIGMLAGLFPHQGGTVTWIVGRVDSQCVPLVLGAVLAQLRGRRAWACLLFALALATKEVAVATPFVALVLVWAQWAGRGGAQGPGGRAAIRSELLGTLPLFATLAALLVVRRLALGVWGGGYPGGLAASLAGTEPLELVIAIATAVLGSMPELLGALVLISLLVYGRGLGAGWQPESRRAVVLLGAAVLAGGLALAPLVATLALGVVHPEHQRTLMLPDALLLLGLGAAFVARPALPRSLAWIGLPLVLLLGGSRAWQAWDDTHDWARAGRLAEELVGAVRTTLADVEPSPHPVLTTTPPSTLDGAYVLHWCVADRFRAPFPEMPRPVWPWRPVIEGPEMERRSVTQPKNHLRWPFGASRRMVPLLRVSEPPPPGGEPLDSSTASQAPLIEELEVTVALLTEPGPLLRCEGYFPGARFEALLFTELGYGIGLFGGVKRSGAMEAVSDGQAPPPFGGTIALRELLLLTPMGGGTGGAPLWEILALAADFGAREAYLELRAADDGRDKTDRAVGASQWIRLHWGPELRDLIKPLDSF